MKEEHCLANRFASGVLAREPAVQQLAFRSGNLYLCEADAHSHSPLPLRGLSTSSMHPHFCAAAAHEVTEPSIHHLHCAAKMS